MRWQRNILLFKEGENAIVQHVGRHQRVLAVVQFGKGDLGVGIDEGLLINSPDALDRADIVRILSSQVAGVRRFDFAVRFLFLFGLFQGTHLRFRQDMAWLLRQLCLQRFEPFGKRL